jgi:predicted phosphodiesterase
MRLGLATDVHNHAAELAGALRLFREHGVDQVVVIGDTCDAFARPDGAAEVARLLAGCGAVGVWGNHDFTLCRDVTPEVRARYPEPVLAFMARMRPRLVLGECHFSHKEASIDPHDVEQLWDVSDRPLDLVERATLGFAAAPQRLQFVGHYHRWWAATPDGPLRWRGETLLRFDPGQRYFVVVGAVCDGWCGVLDAAAGELLPLQCDAD